MVQLTDAQAQGVPGGIPTNHPVEAGVSCFIKINIGI
jgi:hypothetical protein